MRTDIAWSLAAMRQESLLRTVFLVLVLCVLPSLFLATAYPFELVDLVFRLGAPLGHVAHALAIYLVLLAAIIVTSEGVVARMVGPSGKAPSVGVTVSRMVSELANRMAISVETHAFGGGEVEAVQVYRRRIVRIGVGRLRESVLAPHEFRFVIAHELTHLASNDARTDRIVRCVYLVGAVFLLAALARVMWAVSEGLITSWRFGPDAVLASLANSRIALFTNSLSVGTLTLLVVLERRSAMRLREFHADAVAGAIVESGHGITARLRPVHGWRFIRFVARLFGAHPEPAQRREALEHLGAAFQADRILFLLHGYFAAMLMEILLQMLFVGASSGMSSLAERRTYLGRSMSRYPVGVWCAIGSAAILVGLSQLLVVQRIALVKAEATASRLLIRLWVGSVLMFGAGMLLSLLTSQAFLWEVSLSQWNFFVWMKADTDRPALYSSIWVGMALSLALLLVSTRNVHALRQRTVLAASLPVGIVLAVGFEFYG